MTYEDAKVEKIKTRLLVMVSEGQGNRWQIDSDEIKEHTDKIILEQGNKDFKLDEGIVKTIKNKIWIPKKNRNEFINEMHRKLCHAGIRKVTEYVKAGYDMEELQQCIKTQIQNCEACQKRKTMTTKTKEPLITSDVVQPFEVISIDFCGPLRVNTQGKRYILGIIDYCSRYISLTAITKQDEKTAVNTLMKQWILKFGAPRKILLDCGKTFESKMIKELAERYKIHLQYSSPYHHNTNGLIERQFRTIRDYMCSSLKEKLRRDWVEILPEIEFTLNATIQKTIGKSPAEVIFGFKITREWESGIKRESNRDDIIREVQNKQGIKKDKDKNEFHREFEIGDKVLMKVDIRSKEDDRYVGPLQIIKKLHDRSYELIDNNGKTIIRNIEWLRKFKEGGCKDN